MSTTSTKQEVAIVQPNNNGISLIDANINSLLALQIKEMFENKKFTYSTAGALICILYMQDIRDCAKDMLGHVKTGVVSAVSTIYDYAKQYTKTSDENQEPIHTSLEKKQMANVELNVKDEEYLSFICHVMSFPNTICEKDSSKFTLDGKTMTQNYNKIQFSTKGFTGVIINVKMSSFDSTFVKSNVNTSCDDILFGTQSDPKCITDLFLDCAEKTKMKDLLRKLYIYDDQCISYINDDEICNCKNYELKDKFYCGFDSNTINDPYYMRRYLGFLLKKHLYKSFNPSIFAIEVLMIFHSEYSCGIAYKDRILQKSFSIHFGDKKILIDMPFLSDEFMEECKKMALFKDHLQNTLDSFKPIYKLLKDIDISNVQLKMTKKVQLIANNDLEIDLPLEFQKFYNNILNSKPNTNKITIYQLLFNRETKKKTIPNPEYTQKVELIKQLSEKESKMQMSLDNLPPSTISENEEVIEIKTSKINECSKSFETLYLRLEDKRLLMKMLDNFCNSHHIYQEFEIPHKLGILLYGEPGTGKSTTIKTIASYAKRNIYYVDLQNIKTNSELKQLFDYVIKECSGGNILVFEDIDCMTNIVKPREVFEEGYDTLSSVLRTQNDELTLSYFLNLLDGTLCAENTMFIMTTNHIANLDPALIRQGRIDVKMELKKCDRYQIECMYNKIMGEPIDPTILQRIPEGVHRPVDIIHHLIHNKVTNNETDILKPFLDQSPSAPSSAYGRVAMPPNL